LLFEHNRNGKVLFERGADGKIFIENDCKMTFTNKTYSKYAITTFCLVISCKNVF